MDSAIISGLIAVAGAIVGALITVFKEDIRAVFTSASAKDERLLGVWECQWWLSEDESEPPEVEDTVEITKSSEGEVEAEGFAKETMGKYKLYGNLSRRNILTLTFHGAEKENLTGIAILRLNALEDEMYGYWYQWSPQDDFVGGVTRWRHTKYA